MWGTRGRLRASLASLGAIAAVLLLLPVSSAGSLHAPAATATVEKRGALGEVGRAVTDPSTAGVAGHGEFLGVATIAATGATAPQGAPSGPAAKVTTAAIVPTTSPQLLSKFSGASQSTSGGFLPPDTQVAQSGIYVFELVNEFGRITSTNGATVYSTFTTQAFFGTTSTDNVGDIQVFHNGISNRWIVTGDDFTTNVAYFDVSKNASPVGAYWAYSISVLFLNGAAQFMDQPVWGMSKSMYVMSTNQFNTTTPAFYGSILTVLNAAKLNSGHLSYQLFGYTGYFSIHPARAITTNGTGTDVLYLATTGVSAGSTTLTVFEVKGAIGTLTVSTIAFTIANTGTVPGGVQPGTATLVATGDDRVQSVSWSSVAALWVSFSTACTPAGDATIRSCIRVDAIATATNLLLQDADTGVAGTYLYYGALVALTVAAGGSGYLMVLSFSSTLNYPSIAVSGQNTSDNYATFRGPVPVFSGTSYDTSGRFGDYSGIQLTMSGAKATAWGAAEYGTPTGWATEVVHFAFY